MRSLVEQKGWGAEKLDLVGSIAGCEIQGRGDAKSGRRKQKIQTGIETPTEFEPLNRRFSGGVETLGAKESHLQANTTQPINRIHEKNWTYDTEWVKLNPFSETIVETRLKLYRQLFSCQHIHQHAIDAHAIGLTYIMFG